MTDLGEVGSDAVLNSVKNVERPFRTLATLRTDIPLLDDVDELRWNGPTPTFTALAARLDAAITQTRRQRALKGICLSRESCGSCCTQFQSADDDTGATLLTPVVNYS